MSQTTQPPEDSLWERNRIMGPGQAAEKRGLHLAEGGGREERQAAFQERGARLACRRHRLEGRDEKSLVRMLITFP
jgi:hypothetical protein